MEKKHNISSRQKIQALLEKTNGLVTLDNAEKILEVSRNDAIHILWRLSKKGWIKRLKSGLYRVVPLESSDPSFTDEHPWLVALEIFSPCYIGGWTAANFWGLTDQLFMNTWVMTTHPIHKKKQYVSDHEYMLRHINEDHLFGLTTEWIENNKILVSDIHKTVLDFLSFPKDYTAQTMLEILQAYLASTSKNINVFKHYVDKIRNKSTLKRLGFLLERLAPGEQSLIEFCHERISKGCSDLSSQSPCTKIIQRWNLKVPESMKDNKS
jgi:predicted transcriptional regulator of viral defense system